jgi:hypothetical protein
MSFIGLLDQQKNLSVLFWFARRSRFDTPLRLTEVGQHLSQPGP